MAEHPAQVSLLTSSSTATFSPCRTWRYELTRTWDPELPTCAFVGLNPSTADEHLDDPTIRRCIRFAREWASEDGKSLFGGLVMANIFAFRATDPREMKAAPDPVGPENDEHLERIANEAALVVGAWGAHGTHLDRDVHVVEALLRADAPFAVLGLTAGGHPRHPLYMRADCGPLDPLTLEEIDL